MNNRTAKKIKRECKGLAQESVAGVLIKVVSALQERAEKASFWKRFKIGMSYIFKKDISGMLPEE